MLASEIPDYVAEIVATGCDMCAIGDRHYLIGDADLSDEEFEVAAPELQRIGEAYGSCGHLRFEIIAYLRSIGRYVDPATVPMPAAWQEKTSTRRSGDEHHEREAEPGDGHH